MNSSAVKGSSQERRIAAGSQDAAQLEAQCLHPSDLPFASDRPTCHHLSRKDAVLSLPGHYLAPSEDEIGWDQGPGQG